MRIAHRLGLGAVIALVAGCAAHASTASSGVRSFGSAQGDRASAQSNNSRVLTTHARVDATASSNAERPAINAPSASSAHAVAPVASDVEERTVRVEGTDVQAGLVVGELDAPFATVSGTLLDFASYRQFLPRINESRIVRRRRGESDVYLRAELLEGLGTVWSLQRFTITRATGSLLIVGTSIDGTMRRFDVRIEASEIAGTGRTRLAVQLLGLPPFPLPTSYLTRMHGRWTARSYRSLRDWIYAHRGR